MGQNHTCAQGRVGLGGGCFLGIIYPRGAALIALHLRAPVKGIGYRDVIGQVCSYSTLGNIPQQQQQGCNKNPRPGDRGRRNPPARGERSGRGRASTFNGEK